MDDMVLVIRLTRRVVRFAFLSLLTTILLLRMQNVAELLNARDTLSAEEGRG